jgi:hypothetical protein
MDYKETLSDGVKCIKIFAAALDVLRAAMNTVMKGRFP